MWRNTLKHGLLGCLAVMGAGVLHADIYLVQVLGNSFSPADLTIQQGDTVRWTLSPSPGGGCQYYCPPGDEITHTVTGDDGSFSSGPPAESFVFDHVFDQPGEYLYHCEVHSAPGRDIQRFMNGRVFVQGGDDTEFVINAGLNDAWFDPGTAGQGMFITVYPELRRMFFAWFTYDTDRPPEDLAAVVGEPGHRWLTAFGAYEGNTANLEIEMTSGGVFNATLPTPASVIDGSVTIQFSDCNTAEVNYDLASANVQGQIAIERIATDNLPICEAELSQ